MTTAPGPWIRTPEALHGLAARLAGVRAIAIDTEADSLHHYTEKVCLVQIAALGGEAWLVDPLALRDLSALAPVLANPSILKVLHSGDNDVTSMRRDFGFEFRSLFDTSIAARLLGDTELGLASLVRRELGVELNKGNQRDDWSERPLSPRQEAYALADVEHLFALTERFTARLAAAGRMAWAREEFEALALLEAAPRKRDADAFLKIKGATLLRPRAQAVLRELHVWRESRAEAADRPPFKIVAAEVLIAMASAPPTSLDDVARALARYSRLGHEAEVVFAAVQRGLALSEDELPTRARGKRPSFNAEERRRIEALRVWRTAEAERVKLDPSVVLPQRLIERIAEAGPRSIDELAAVEGVRKWRVETWGEALLKAAA